MLNEEDVRHKGRWLLFEDAGDKFNVAEIFDKKNIERRWVWVKEGSDNFLSVFHRKCLEIFPKKA